MYTCKLRKGCLLITEWIIHLKLLSTRLFSFPHRHPQPHQTSSPFLAGKLISINFYSCIAEAEKKVRGVRRSKLKRPREHRKSSIDLFWMSREKKKRIYERRKWLKFQKMFIWWVVWCVMLPIFDFYFFLQTSSEIAARKKFISALLSINRQILMTWQSSRPRNRNANSLSFKYQRPILVENRAG